MPELALWLILLVLFAVGAVVTRFNPAIMYRRGTLIRLTVCAIVLIGIALMAGFYGVPSPTRSGVFNVNGG
jgi:hypothetical protein